MIKYGVKILTLLERRRRFVSAGETSIRDPIRNLIVV